MSLQHQYENALIHADYYEEMYKRLKGAMDKETDAMYLSKIDFWNAEVEKIEKEILNGAT